jgi:hypothetical protein
MKVHLIALAVAAVLVLPSATFATRSETAVTAAGSGTYPAGSTYKSVTLSGLRMGFGVAIPGDGSAQGQFDATLTGTSSAGQPQTVTITGSVSGGTRATATTATFSGTCTVDMGDGSTPSTDVPFSATVTSDGSEKGTIALTLGASKLSIATITDGTLSLR